MKTCYAEDVFKTFWKTRNVCFDRLGASAKKSVLLIFINKYVSCKYIQRFNLPRDILAIPFEKALKQQRRSVVSIHRAPNQNLNSFLSSIMDLFDHYLQYFQDFVISGGFNEDENHSNIESFLGQQSRKNIIKSKMF